jgi:polyferredoxin
MSSVILSVWEKSFYEGKRRIWGDKMKNVTVAVVYLAFGVFFLFAGVSMLGISGTVQANYSANGAIDPVFVLTAGGLTVVAASFLFLVLTFRFFRGELFGE